MSTPIPRTRVLVVEDEQKVAHALSEGLEGEQYEVVVEHSGEGAFFRLNTEAFDVILLDLMLPGRDGLQILRTLRERGDKTPVLVLTARDTLDDRVNGLDSGADDYLVKPFDLDELLARTRAVIRRHGGRGQSEVAYGALSVDPVQRRVLFHGAEVELSPREFAVLEALMKEPGAVVSRERLEDAVYGWGEEIGSNSIEVHVHHLRRKLASVELKYGRSDFERRHYGLLADNIEECRANVLAEYLNLDRSDELYRAGSYVLSQNLVHGDARKMHGNDAVRSSTMAFSQNNLQVCV